MEDLLILLAAWGSCGNCSNCPEDITGDCNVGVADLLALLASWGPVENCDDPNCPPEEIGGCWERFETGTPEFEECIGDIAEEEDPPGEPD